MKTPLLPMLLGALAGGMGWGIRGQYGHETGAMMAGLLVSSVAAVLFGGQASGLGTLRAIAWGTLGIGIGGSMTYGQIIGWTQNHQNIGDWNAWAWGMQGLAVTGAIWIGFGGAFLGMGLGGKKYTATEMLVLLGCLLGLYHLGVWLLNQPFDPKNQQLPWLYFSNRLDKPRFECWGGLGLALTGLLVYLAGKNDTLGWRLGWFGVLGGALGFPGGQSWQSWHAWNREWIATTWFGPWAKLINWWNLMEITFGMVMGATLLLGLWWNRARIHPADLDCELSQAKATDGWFLFAHLTLLSLAEFLEVPLLNTWYGLGLVMVVLPLVASVESCRWSGWVVGPVVVLPIAGKTLRYMVERHGELSAMDGLVYLVAPLVVAFCFAWRLNRKVRHGCDGSGVGCRVLLFGAWIFFLLNFAFFDYPWPWQPWTGRTPSALVYVVCLAGLSWVAFGMPAERASCQTGGPVH